MNELQQRLCDILFWFHDFCEQNKLTYYICYGTFLGAVRHKGFIPWDDDLDVAMPRTDYKKCQSIFLTNNSQIEKYRLETPQSEAPDFIYPFTKLYDTTTTLVEETFHFQIKRGIYIDIFPLDGAGNSLHNVCSHFRKINFYNMLRVARLGRVSKYRDAYKNIAIFLAHMIPSPLVDEKYMAVKIDELCQQHAYESCEYVGALSGVYRTKDIMPKNVFGIPALYSFEGRQIYGPALANEYLTRIYGDWRKLPPKEKRGIQHSFVYIDFNKSYLDCEA